MCVIFVFTLIDYISKQGSFAISVFQNIASTISIGIVAGIVLGMFWLLMLRKIEDNSPNTTQYFYMMTMALLVFTYVLVENLGGSSVVAIFIFSLMIGNSSLLEEFFSRLTPVKFYRIDKSVSIVNFQIAFLIKSFFFVLIGIMISFSIYVVGVALIIYLILLFARYLTINLLPQTRNLISSQKQLLYFSVPRGLAAGALAIQVSSYSNLIPEAGNFVNIVFGVIIISILFATLGLFLYKPLSNNTISS